LTSTSIQVRHLILDGPGPSLPEERLFVLNKCVHLLYIFPKPEEVRFEFGSYPSSSCTRTWSDCEYTHQKCRV